MLVPIEEPKTFNEIHGDRAIICVIRNGSFDAAGYCFDEIEFEAFKNLTVVRPRAWLTMDKDLANKLTNRI